MNDNEWDFVHEDVALENINLFDMEPQQKFNDTHCLAHIMCWAGAFPSVSQARKNGWGRPVPFGFSEFKVGKRKRCIFILNRIGEK
jgi:hypothetical protein|tara:strand:+ start:112 stop:369 length:258 start_codon:yes stop_codon:yes gene_type:complete